MPTTAINLLEEKDRVEAFLRRSRNPLSAASFVNIFIWQDFFDFKLEEIDGNLCVFASNEIGSFLYLPPLGGEISSYATAECFKRMIYLNKGSSVSRIENIPQEQLKYFDPSRYSYFEKSPDYVYRRQDIASLKGIPYKTQRWAYNHFIKNYRHEFIDYDPSMEEACMQLYDRWAQARAAHYEDPVYRQMLNDNEKVHARVFKYYRELGLIGRVVYADDRLVGYTFGYPLNEKTFCILCEVTDLSLKGLSVFIFSGFCRDEALQPFSLINVMDDSGMDNIRQAKLSFHPAEIILNGGVLAGLSGT